jgi:branched-chain amino acid transport system ATP-binding protein
MSTAPQNSPAASSPLLTVNQLSMRFGGLVAVDGVSFTAQPNAITAVIGPNGAGKTTLFNCITGFYRPTSGSLSVPHPTTGQPLPLQTLPTHQIVQQAGIVRTFQNIRLFGGMSVLENVLTAQHAPLMQAGGGLAGLLGLARYRRAEAAAHAQARHWLQRFDLLADANRPAAELSYGAQRRLEIARALCLAPRLLCLDEPAAGLNPRESADLTAILRLLRTEAICAILLIEHDMGVVMDLSDHIVVLDYGRVIAAAAPAAIRANPAVIRAYLGEDAA